MNKRHGPSHFTNKTGNARVMQHKVAFV